MREPGGSRYGAIGRHGSIAVVERLIRTLKTALRCLCLIPLTRTAFRRELESLIEWYNDSRPHTTLKGQTPNERYFRRFPAHRKPRYEPRARWPRGSPCAKPWALVRGKLGAKLDIHVEFQGGHKHLPVVSLRCAG
jgi:hypothetical protein